MPIKYDKYGLRRDKNLSDVEDASLALTNILNDLALPGQTFIDKDLLVINNLAQTDVTSEVFSRFSGSAVKTTQLKKTYTIRVEFPGETITVDPGFEFIIDDNDAVLINASEIVGPDITQNSKGFSETILTIQVPPVDLNVEIGDTIDMGNVPYTVLAVLGISDTQNIFTIKPQITLKDQLEYYYLSTGNKIKMLSGDGPDAYFFNSLDINPVLESVTSIDELLRHPLNNFSPTLYGPYDFWEDGQFFLNRRIFDSNRFNDTAGGIFFQGNIELDPNVFSHELVFSADTNGYFAMETWDPDLERWIGVGLAAPATIDLLPDPRDGAYNFYTQGSNLYILSGSNYSVQNAFYEKIVDGVIQSGSTGKVDIQADTSGSPLLEIVLQNLVAVNLTTGVTSTSDTEDIVIPRDVYDKIFVDYVAAERAAWQELNEGVDDPEPFVEPEFLPGTFYVTSDIGEYGGSITIIPVTEGIDENGEPTRIRTSAIKIPRTKHFLERVLVRMAVYWPQEVLGWDSKFFKFSSESAIFGNNFEYTRLTKSNAPEDYPTNKESLFNTFNFGSRLGSNVLEEGVSVKNTLRAIYTPPIDFTHVAVSDDSKRYTLPLPRPIYEFSNIIPVQFNSPGVFGYTPAKGPLRDDKSPDNLQIRSGDYIINHFDSRYYNTYALSSDSTIDQLSPAELQRVRDFPDISERGFLYYADNSANPGTSIPPIIIDRAEALNNMPIAIGMKAFASDYASVVNDSNDFGVLIKDYARKDTTPTAAEQIAISQIDVTQYGDETTDRYSFAKLLGPNSNILRSPASNLTPGQFFVGGGAINQYQQLCVSGNGLVSIVKPKGLLRNGVVDPGLTDTFMSVIADEDTTISTDFIKKDNFVAGFKSFSDLIYSPYFTTKREVMTLNTPSSATLSNHGFEDRSIVVYHKRGDDQSDYQRVEKYVKFIDPEFNYEIVNADEFNEDEDSGWPIYIYEDVSEFTSPSYERKGVVSVSPDGSQIAIQKVIPSTLSTNTFLSGENYYLNTPDELEAIWRYMRDVDPDFVPTEATFDDTPIDMGSAGDNVVIDLVEYDNSGIPESVLGVSLFRKYGLSANILAAKPWYPTSEFIETDPDAIASTDGVPVRREIDLVTGPVSNLQTLIQIPDPEADPNDPIVPSIFVEYTFVAPARILSDTAQGWIFTVDSQTYQSALTEILTDSDNGIVFTPTRVLINDVNRPIVKEVAYDISLYDGNTEPEQWELQDLDLPISGAWSIDTIDVITGVDDEGFETFDTRPLFGPIDDSESSYANEYLSLQDGELLVKEFRDVLIKDFDSNNNPIDATVNLGPNAKVFIEYTSQVGTNVDLDDYGGSVFDYDEYVGESLSLFQQGSQPEFVEIPHRLTSYRNTLTSKSIKGGVQAPIWAPSTKPMAIKTVSKNDAGDPVLTFNNFNNIPDEDNFTIHNGWKNTGLLIDPWPTHYAAIYSDKGIVDYSKLSYCQDVIPLTSTVGANVGATEILLSVDDAAVAQVGYFVQFSGYVSPGTLIESVSADRITLSAPLLKDIEPGYILTTAPDNLRDYEICTISLNTAPPFEGTETGLSTTDQFPELEVNELIFENLSIKTAPTTVITDETTATGSLTINYVDDNLVKTPFKLISR